MKTHHFTILLAFLSISISCKEVNPNRQVDEGAFENDTYTSQEIGWTIKVPENWDITAKDKNEKQMQTGLEAVEETVGNDVDVSGLKNLLGYEKNMFNNFQSNSQPFQAGFSGDWEENNANLKKLIYATYEGQGIRADSTVTTIVNVDGLDFHSYGFEIYDPEGNIIMNQILYSRLINGLDFGVNINYNNEEDKKEMLTSWLASKFKK